MKDTLNTYDGKYGIFVYSKNSDENLINYYTENKREALNFAEDLSASEKEFDEEIMYLEVWEKDKDGLWGNKGKPLFKSDEIKDEEPSMFTKAFAKKIKIPAKELQKIIRSKK